MKYISLLVVFLAHEINAQEMSKGSIEIASNLAWLTADLSNLGPNENTYLKDGKKSVGYGIGLRKTISMTKSLALHFGLEFNKLNGEFHRRYYDNPNAVFPNTSTVIEEIELYRLGIPVGISYPVACTKTVKVYLTAGCRTIILNRMLRTVDYSLPGPPGGYVSHTYKNDHNFGFGEDDRKIGINAFAGGVIQSRIKQRSYSVELKFNSDISKSKFYTLNNIEEASHFFW